MPDETTTSEDENNPRDVRLKVALELRDEGYSDVGIANYLNLDEASVRGILAKYDRSVYNGPLFLRSSLAVSLTNHTPEDHVVKDIERIRKAADDLCMAIDDVCPYNKEKDAARCRLEEAVMWAVKSAVLPST